VNLLTGGPEVGRRLVEHPGVDKVSFTGSTSRRPRAPLRRRDNS
jgi:acyl-CoA reductase-like NAD-dependent aldehyde dehydrogenase